MGVQTVIPGMGYLPTLPYPSLGARGSGLGAGAGLILDYREIKLEPVLAQPSQPAPSAFPDADFRHFSSVFLFLF